MHTEHTRDLPGYMRHHWQGDPQAIPDYAQAMRGCGPLSPLQGNTRAMRRAFPEFTREDHDRAARWHAKQHEAATLAWNALAELGSQTTWNRPYSPGDYKISGIVSDDFPLIIKDALRMLAWRQSAHSTLAYVHQKTRAMRKDS